MLVNASFKSSDSNKSHKLLDLFSKICVNDLNDLIKFYCSHSLHLIGTVWQFILVRKFFI